MPRNRRATTPSGWHCMAFAGAAVADGTYRTVPGGTVERDPAFEAKGVETRLRLAIKNRKC